MNHIRFSIASRQRRKGKIHVGSVHRSGACDARACRLLAPWHLEHSQQRGETARRVRHERLRGRELLLRNLPTWLQVSNLLLYGFACSFVDYDIFFLWWWCVNRNSSSIVRCLLSAEPGSCCRSVHVVVFRVPMVFNFYYLKSKYFAMKLVC